MGIGSTALHLAAANGEEKICKEIIDCPRFTLGVNAENNNGLTPLDFCLEFGEGEAAEVLRAAGGKTSGRTARTRQREDGCRQRQAPMESVDEDNGNDMGALD